MLLHVILLLVVVTLRVATAPSSISEVVSFSAFAFRIRVFARVTLACAVAVA